MPHEEREEIIINSEEVMDYMFEELVALGYAPTEDEIEDISMIMCQFLVNKGLLNEL